MSSLLLFPALSVVQIWLFDCSHCAQSKNNSCCHPEPRNMHYITKVVHDHTMKADWEVEAQLTHS
jgi:hypothetical protein